MADWCSGKVAPSSPVPGNSSRGSAVTPHAVRNMTPGLNLSRYERPLAERRLLGGAVRDRWEPTGSHLVVSQPSPTKTTCVGAA